MNIQKNSVDGFVLQRTNRVFPGFRFKRLVTELGALLVQRPAHQFFIVDDQNSFLGHPFNSITNQGTALQVILLGRCTGSQI